MTDRITGFTVALTHDIRDDDCQRIIDAILMVKGVEGVQAHVVDTSDYLARQNVKAEIREKVFDLLKAL